MKYFHFNVCNWRVLPKLFFVSFVAPFVCGVNQAYSISLDIANPSFELVNPPDSNQLLGWDAIGSVGQSTGFNSASKPTDGKYAAGLIAVGSADATRAALETFLELPAGALNTLNQGTVNGGSALAQLVALDAGKRLTFDYDFGIFNFNNTEDFIFFSIAQQFSPEIFFDSQVFVLADTSSGLSIPPGDFFPETGYRTFSFPVLEKGIYRIGFGVVNANGNQVQSAAQFDNVRVVPEPSSFILICSGFGLLVLARKYRWPPLPALVVRVARVRQRRRLRSANGR